MTGSQNISIRPAHDETGREYFHHSSGQRISTDTVIVEALRKQARLRLPLTRINH
jgi:hypothetical protein